MRKNRYKKLLILMIVVLFVVILLITANDKEPVNVLAESNQIVRFYEVPSKSEADRRIRFFNEEDLSDFINHIEFLSENSKAIGRPDVLGASLKVKEFLEMLMSTFLVSGKYEAVELRIASITAKVNGKRYLMPFAAELYGVLTNDGLEIHKQ